MKNMFIASALLISSFSAYTETSNTTSNIQQHGSNIVAQRLASKSLSEIVVLAMQLQVECQQYSSQDVCEGVKTILELIDARIASMPIVEKDTSLAFLQGLIDGVSHANEDIISQLGNAPISYTTEK